MNEWLIFRNLKKNYGDFPALKGVSFSSHTKGIVGLIGPNGAGKTTLIRILLGLIQKDEGECLLLGQDVWNESKLLKKKLGVLLERPSYPSGLTVKEYIRLVQKLYRSSPKDFDIEEWCHKLALPPDRPIGALSAGMRRKMGLLSALASQAEVIIMDEPTANIDPVGREQILQLILDVQKRLGVKFLLSSHILFDLEKIADEVIILADGMVLEAGKTLEILKKYGQSNEYICTVLEPSKFIAALQNKDWILEATSIANQIIIKTRDIPSWQIFQNIIQVSNQENMPLLHISQTGSLTQVFRRMKNE